MDRFPRRPGSVRLALELLEPRDVLSTCVVNSLGDTGVGVAADHGDLRFCVNRANALAGPDTITFAVTGSVMLTSPMPDLTDTLDIKGPGAALLSVTNATTNGRVFHVAPGATVRIGGITISGGNLAGSPAYGGGIYNDGMLVLDQASVRDNYVVGLGVASRGGGIFNAGDLTVENSTLDDDSAEVTYVWAGNSQGGGIYNVPRGHLTVLNSTFSHNYVIGEWSPSGGGLCNDGTATIDNSTFAFNYTVGNSLEMASGSGIQANGTTTIAHSTIAYNYMYANVTHGLGGGIAGTVRSMTDTIVADNKAKSGAPDLYGSLAVSAYNLIGNSSGGSGYTQTDLLDVDPRLGGLGDNGGPTKTIGLLAGSLAIDSGDNTDAPDWDQRGPGYPRIVNGTIDRGAFEVQNTAGPAAGRSVLVTAPRPALSTPGAPQPASFPASYRQPVPTTALVAMPGAVGKPAAPVFHAGHLVAAVPDLAVEGLDWDWR
jgi:hypothetical protein